MSLPLWRHRYSTSSSILDYFYSNQHLNVGLVVQGITVIDLDTKEIPDDFSRIEFDDTLTSETGNGFQFFFQADPIIRTSAKVLSDCIDTRCNGSFVVLPPSIHKSGFQYRWVTCAGLEKLPIPVRRLWQKNYFKQGEYRTLHLPATIPEGCRNDTLFRYGRTLRRQDMTFAEIELELNQANSFRCDPPLGSLEMCRLIRNVWYLQDRRDFCAARFE
jgi:hypothetical protein